MEEKKFRLWAAHDKGDSAHTVWLYSEKPTLNTTNDGYWSSLKNMRGCVDESFIPELTFENSPKEIEIAIKVKQQENMKEVVIEIYGKRHRLYNKDKVTCGCPVCSLAEQCQDAELLLCFPFLKENEYGHFELVDK